MSNSSGKTPLMRQYNDIKAKYPDTILLFRVGDFYETFSDDAITVSKELGITLTKRNNGGDMTPLAGFPYHSIDSYMPKLIRRGYKVAVCEQTEDPATAKANKRKIVEREVTEIVTPGVTVSDKLLSHNRNNFVAAVHITGTTAGLAFCDVSTGEFAVTQIPSAQVKETLVAIQAAEVLVNKRKKSDYPIDLDGFNHTWREDWLFDGDYGYRTLLEHFGTHSLKGFGIEELKLAHVAAGVIIDYIKETQRSSLGHLRKIYTFENSDYMMLDTSTKRNLELIANMNEGGTEGSLFGILDDTCTAPGGRLLRQWVMRPLRKLRPISERLNAVEALHINDELRLNVREQLQEIADLERLITRICVNRTNPREMVNLQFSLMMIPRIKTLIQNGEEPLIQRINSQLRIFPDIIDRINRALKEDPNASMKDGGYIRDGFSPDLDELRDIAKNGKQYVARIRQDLVEKTGITSLKLGYNKVFGYYIEVTNTHKDKVPDTFIRKQTLVNCERYITPELKEIEEKILSAEEKMVSLESELFEELRQFVAQYTEEIQVLANGIATLDCLQSLAQVAKMNRYCKPNIKDDEILEIREGRHPVVEKSLPPGEPFIPNDILLENDSRQIMIITGPNMAGKSIILRQTGLIVLLAQIGSFVPADSATIGIVDKIFTRVGASDNLAAGESTFLVEMNEAANILNNATPRSLILLDEVGRGTSTFDGLSIAWSLAEYLHNQPAVAAKTLFATHYHELNELAELYDRIHNYNVEVTEHNGKVIFLRKLVEGGADHSYGIQVAAMAGLPELLILRAKEILANLESHALDIVEGSGNLTESKAKHQATKQAVKNVQPIEMLPQLSLFQASLDPATERILDKLRAADPNRMTPIDSLLLVTELKSLLK